MAIDATVNDPSVSKLGIIKRDSEFIGAANHCVVGEMRIPISTLLRYSALASNNPPLCYSVLDHGDPPTTGLYSVGAGLAHLRAVDKRSHAGGVTGGVHSPQRPRSPKQASIIGL